MNEDLKAKTDYEFNRNNYFIIKQLTVINREYENVGKISLLVAIYFQNTNNVTANTE